MTRPTFVTALVGIITSTMLCLMSCKEAPPEPPPHQVSIELSVEDASCTEAWLKVSLTDASQPRTVAVQQDGRRVLTAQMTTADSVFVVEGLLPRHTYSYVVQRLRYTSVIDVSSPVQATTMDTTSHSFSFHMDTLGVTSSMLNDATIISSVRAYAVGEVYLRDSTGHLEDSPHNVVVWDGTSWKTNKLTYSGLGSGIRFVYARSGGDVWFDPWFHWDGQQFSELPIDPVFMGIRWNKMWGSPGGGLFVVGDGGSIVLSPSQGGFWERIQSGTNVALNDVWGGSNRWAGENVVLVAGSNKYSAGEMKLLRINSDGVLDSIPWHMPDRRINSVWFDGHSHIFTSGGGVFRYRGEGLWSEQPVPLIYTNRIRGNAENDIWVVGDFGFAAHFNGYTWRTYPEVWLGSGDYLSLAVKGDAMIAVGSLSNRAIILRGVR